MIFKLTMELECNIQLDNRRRKTELPSERIDRSSRWQDVC